MKSSLYLFLLFIIAPLNLFSQIQSYSDQELSDQIKSSSKKYKVIYIFCDYCFASQHRYPMVVEALQKNNSEIDFFPICAQDSAEIAAYADTCKVSSKMYLINQDRKRKKISFYNPIKVECKFLKKTLNINSDKMGASDICVLDKDNHIIFQTNWEMKDDEYFKLLNKLNTELPTSPE